MPDYDDFLNAVNDVENTLVNQGCLRPTGVALDKYVIRAMIDMLRDEEFGLPVLESYHKRPRDSFGSYTLEAFILWTLQGFFENKGKLNQFVEDVHVLCDEYDDLRAVYVQALGQVYKQFKAWGSLKQEQRVVFLDGKTCRDLVEQFYLENTATDVFAKYDRAGGDDVCGSLYEFILNAMRKAVFAYDQPFYLYKPVAANRQLQEGHEQHMAEPESRNDNDNGNGFLR